MTCCSPAVEAEHCKTDVRRRAVERRMPHSQDHCCSGSRWCHCASCTCCYRTGRFPGFKSLRRHSTPWEPTQPQLLTDLGPADAVKPLQLLHARPAWGLVCHCRQTSRQMGLDVCCASAGEPRIGLVPGTATASLCCGKEDATALTQGALCRRVQHRLWIPAGDAPCQQAGQSRSPTAVPVQLLLFLPPPTGKLTWWPA